MSQIICIHIHTISDDIILPHSSQGISEWINVIDSTEKQLHNNTWYFNVLIITWIFTGIFIIFYIEDSETKYFTILWWEHIVWKLLLRYFLLFYLTLSHVLYFSNQMHINFYLRMCRIASFSIHDTEQNVPRYVILNVSLCSGCAWQFFS